MGNKEVGAILVGVLALLGVLDPSIKLALLGFGAGVCFTYLYLSKSITTTESSTIPTERIISGIAGRLEQFMINAETPSITLTPSSFPRVTHASSEEDLPTPTTPNGLSQRGMIPESAKKLTRHPSASVLSVPIFPPKNSDSMCLLVSISDELQQKVRFSDADAAFFRMLDERIRRSKNFMTNAAQVLHRAYCMINNSDTDESMDIANREALALGYSPIPAVLGAVSLLSLQRTLSLASNGSASVTRTDFLTTLRLLSNADVLTTYELFVIGIFAHSAWAATLPFRGLSSTDFKYLQKESNQSFFSLGTVDKSKTIMIFSRAAYLILEELDPVCPSEEDVPEVFLGGACNPTTWRVDEAVPRLQAAGISFYNPQVEEWTPELVPIEAAAKEQAPYLFFVISARTRGLASLVEAAEYIARGRKMFLVCEDVPEGAILGDLAVSVHERKDLNRGRTYLRDVAKRHPDTVFVFEYVEDALDALCSEIQYHRSRAD